MIALSLHCASSQSKGLFNKNLTIVGEHWEPFFVIEEHSDGTETYRFVKNWLCFNFPFHYYINASHSGVMWELILFMQHARNFSFTITRPPNYDWGTCIGSNNCSGMIGLVNRKEADFAIGW